MAMADWKFRSIALLVSLLLCGVTSVEKEDEFASESFVPTLSPMRSHPNINLLKQTTFMSRKDSLFIEENNNSTSDLIQTANPSLMPILVLSPIPSVVPPPPTIHPTAAPSKRETEQPTTLPSLSIHPSIRPTTLSPSLVPSMSTSPSLSPTTFQPTSVPTFSLVPTSSPTATPTMMPSQQRVVNTPIVSPPGGNGVMVLYVSIRCENPSDATIYYTLDGTKPTDKSGLVYTPASDIPLYADDCHPCKLRAVAYRDNWKHSSVVEKVFDVKRMVDPPILTPPVGTFVGLVNVEVNVKEVHSADVRYTTNASESLGLGLVDEYGLSLDGYKGLQVHNGKSIQLAFSGNGGGSQIVTLKCMGVNKDYAPSTVVLGEYLLLAQSPPPIFSPDYEEPQPAGAYFAMAVKEDFPKPTTIYWTTDGTDPIVPGRGNPNPVSQTQRSCEPSKNPDKHCEVHIDEVGTILFKAVSVAVDYEPSLVASKSVEIQARCPPPVFDILSTSSQTYVSEGVEAETFTSFVAFQFLIPSKSDTEDTWIEYEVVGVAGTGSRTTVELGVEVIWKQLGVVTLIARAKNLGMFDSPDVEQTFVIVEPSYEVYPAQAVDMTEMTLERNRRSLLEIDPSVPSLTLQPFEKLVRDHNLEANCEIMLRGVQAVIPQPERFVSVVPPANGHLSPSVLSSSAYRFTGIPSVPKYDQFLVHSFEDRPHWLVDVVGLSEHNISDLVARAWADEAAWLSYHTQPLTQTAILKQAEQQWSQYSGCSLAVTGGLRNMTSNRPMGHVVSDGAKLQVDDGKEFMDKLGVKRAGFLGVDFGIDSNHSFVVGYIPSDDLNKQKQHRKITQLLTGEVWLVRKSKTYVFESLAHGGMNTVDSSEFANKRLGRTAWGHDQQGRLVVVSIDGVSLDASIEDEASSSDGSVSDLDDDEVNVEEDVCEEDGSKGATLLELAQLMLDLGCINAVAGEGGSSEMIVNGVRVGGAMGSCAKQDMDASEEDWVMRSRCSVPASAMLCVHVAPPPVIDLYANSNKNTTEADLLSFDLSELVWPWSASRHPTMVPSSSTSRVPTSLPTPTRSPTRTPVPQPTMKKIVVGSDDDYYTPPDAFDDAEMDTLNSTAYGREEDPEAAFYKTSTMMLLITLILSGFLHLWTWNQAVKEQERREREGGGDYMYDGDDDRRNKLRAPPVISYGGNSYGTKVATSPIAALKDLARRSTRKKPRGYALVDGGGIEEYDEEGMDDEPGMEMVDTVIRGRGGIFNQDSDDVLGQISSPSFDHTAEIDDVEDEEDEEEEDFESRFKRLDSRHEAPITLGRVMKGLLPTWLGGETTDELPKWQSMNLKGDRSHRRQRVRPKHSSFDMDTSSLHTPTAQSASGITEVEINPFALINDKEVSRGRMVTPRMVAVRAQKD